MNMSNSELENYLKYQIEEFKIIEHNSEKLLGKAPLGCLCIQKSGKNIQYYHKYSSDIKHKKYIKKDNASLIRSLAQKEYTKKLLDAVKKKHTIFQNFLDENNALDLIDIYEKMHVNKKPLIVPYIYPDDEFTKIWNQEKIKTKEKLNTLFPNKYELNDKNNLYTENGELVRSKSEKILADKFYMKNIPYIYEMPLKLNGYGYIRPDFTLLNVNTRKEYYWEHFGIMDKKSYMENTIKKLNQYAQNGYVPGKNLIITFETSTIPLNIKTVEKFIETYLM